MSGATDDALQDEALDWLVRLNSGRASAGDHRAFQDWRARSPAHDDAAREAETLWQEIGETPMAQAFAAGAFAADAAVVAFAPRRSLSRRLWLTGAVAASAALLVGGSGAFGPMAGLFADHVTRRGERREVVLPDGSVAWLNSESAISVAYRADSRRISLTAGEALFEVKPDGERPFIVSAGGGEAQALGTVYSVRHRGDAVDVAVAHGRVEVRSGGISAQLLAGQGIRYAGGRLLSAVHPVDAAATTGWSRGKLIFNARPLREVIDELQRYRFSRLVIADADLGELPVTGVFNLDDDLAILDLLQQTLPIKLVKLPFLTVLRRPA